MDFSHETTSPTTKVTPAGSNGVAVSVPTHQAPPSPANDTTGSTQTNEPTASKPPDPEPPPSPVPPSDTSDFSFRPAVTSSPAKHNGDVSEPVTNPDPAPGSDLDDLTLNDSSGTDSIVDNTVVHQPPSGPLKTCSVRVPENPEPITDLPPNANALSLGAVPKNLKNPILGDSWT